VNRIVFHSSAQQPLDTKPGNTMVGTHFNRNITWAEQARPVVTYLSRNSYLLSQGLFVADFAYLLNEGAPSSQPFWGAGLQPALPDGYDYDTINADVLLRRASVSADGRLVLPDGMSYRILVLPQIDRIRPELLKKIRDLVAGGVTVIGPKPVMSPSLQGGYPNADADVQALAAEIWGDLDGAQRNKHFYGKGLVTWGLPPAQVLALLNVPKDAELAGPLDSNFVWIHRRAGDADIYFVANRTDRAKNLEARFRVGGKEAELWHPDTGEIEPAGYTIENGLTTVPLHLAERDSVFVVFRKATANLSRTLPDVTSATLATVGGPWEVSFPPNWGAPEKIQLEKLESWTANTNEGVKYFSGTATYTRELQAPQTWFRPGTKILLDLGSARDLADVSLNGKALATLWKPPYQVDVTDALKPGANQLEIKITNEWTNRQIGDRSVPAERQVLTRGGGARAGGRGAGGGAFGRVQTLADAGLLGPVSVVSIANK
jgi:hypothetical protein